MWLVKAYEEMKGDSGLQLQVNQGPESQPMQSQGREQRRLSVEGGPTSHVRRTSPPPLLCWSRDVATEGGSLPIIRATSRKCILLNSCSLGTASADLWAPGVLAEAPSQTRGDPGSSPAFPDGMLWDPGKASDLSTLGAAGLGPLCMDTHLLHCQGCWAICIRRSEIPQRRLIKHLLCASHARYWSLSLPPFLKAMSILLQACLDHQLLWLSMKKSNLVNTDLPDVREKANGTSKLLLCELSRATELMQCDRLNFPNTATMTISIPHVLLTQ